MKVLYLHIGLPKTATSFLQQEFFPKLKAVYYLDIPENNLREPVRKLMQQKLAADDYKEIGQIISQKTKPGRNLISNEGFFGGMYYPKKDRIDILKDIQNTFQGFQVKIIVGIREQADYISSLYKQYLHEGGIRDFPGFLEEMGRYNRTEAGFLDTYKYTNYLGQLVKIFGRNNVYVYIYEQLGKDRSEFLRGLLEFLGEKDIPVMQNTVYNRGYGAYQMRLACFFNRFFKSSFNPKGIIPSVKIPRLGRLSPRLLLQNRLTQRLIYKKYKMPESIAAKIREYYAEDNCKVKEEYALELPESYLKS